jgi:hypothetical protein
MYSDELPVPAKDVDGRSGKDKRVKMQIERCKAIA